MRPRSLASVALAVGILGVGLPTATSVVDARSDPPPACAYKDVLTPFRSSKDWRRTLVDTIYKVPRSYVPRDLRSTGVSGGGSVRSLVVADLRAMFAAAKSAGASMTIVSSYRSYATQVSTYNGWVRTVGTTRARLASARPGHSEHQLGTAIDVTSFGAKDPWYFKDWGATKPGAWMRNEAWKYGFIMSYPKGRSPSVTCYKYEPWHFRYVGKDVAKKVHDSALTTREYLWMLLP